VVLTVLPFFHIYGFNGILNPSVFYGMHMVTIPKFTPEDYIACVAKFKVTTRTVTIHSCYFEQLWPIIGKHLKYKINTLVHFLPTAEYIFFLLNRATVFARSNTAIMGSNPT
jgi:acyl-CoA synthetase (AMP-forming)/AMP-acid ligase II